MNCSFSTGYNNYENPLLSEKPKYPRDRNSNISPVAQRENCLANDRVVYPSTHDKTIELKQFGIQVMIPDNYRTLLRNDGSVSILNPVDYDIIVCNARGGRGGRGYYSNFIRIVPNPNRLELRQLIDETYIQDKSVNPYSSAGIQGFIVDFRGRYVGRSSYFVEIPSISAVLEISASCDCEVTSKDLVPFLNSIGLIKK